MSIPSMREAFQGAQRRNLLQEVRGAKPKHIRLAVVWQLIMQLFCHTRFA